MVADIKRNSLLSNYKKRFSSISSSSQEERKEEEKKEKENNILQKNNKNFDKQNDNSFKAINVNTNESFQKSNSLISSTSTLLNSFSFQSSCHPSTIEKAWTTTDKEKSFIHYLKTNTSTNISVTTTDSSKTKKVVYDPISLSEYSSDIFNYMKELEVKMLPDPNYIKHQQEITWNARTILINWIAEVHWKFRMQPETLYLTINIIDRFLSIKSIKLNKFQLLGLCSLLISAKYEEMVVPSIKDLVYMVNHMYTHEEIIQAERCVLVLLGFDLGYPGPMNFLRRISKADGYNTKTRTMAKYLIEITLLDEHFLNCPPSLVASAAVLLARKILFNDQNWNKLFIYYSGYHEHLLIPVAQNIINYALPKAEHSQLPFFKKKYSIDSFKKVSLYVSNWIKNQCAMEKSKEKK
ncbi:A/B/D/E cyclin [Piromyces finnis]|uniref:A/B/D/E cyclin n=1 Tax=Piromyces finnis TaxID=1754191 RepID=A0A1Y1VK23_9FUNG|nr:A/B/D/E cyclin [Piromyces finnis]|eukprot:ORX58440.1 A/B/D/E cyclin [Piromyces finnis]